MTEQSDPQVLERGDLYFFYRPRISADQSAQDAAPHAVAELQRFYLVLHPEHKARYRLLVVGHKRLPEVEQHEPYWLTVDKVASRPDALLERLKQERYATKTRGERTIPEARACGEGVYSIVQSGRQSYFVYQMQYPSPPGKVQHALALKPAASYVLAVKNQALAGTQSKPAADFPDALQNKFHDVRFIPVNPVDFLDYAHAELLLIGAHADIKETLGKNITTEEKPNTERIFSDLRLWRNEHTTRPLFEGEWA